MWRWVLVTQSQRKLRIILTAWVWVSHLSADLSEELSCYVLSLCSLLCALCSNKMHFAKDQLLVCIFGSTHVCVLWQCSAVSAGVGDSITGGQVIDVCTTKLGSRHLYLVFFCFWSFVFCFLLLLNICILYFSSTSIELQLSVRPKWAADNFLQTVVRHLEATSNMHVVFWLWLKIEGVAIYFLKWLSQWGNLKWQQTPTAHVSLGVVSVGKGEIYLSLGIADGSLP